MRPQCPMAIWQNHQEYAAPSPDVLHKLELSRKRAARVATREMHCPICGFLVQIIPVTQTEVVFVKCRKCKFSGPLDPAYFRRVKRNSPFRRRNKAEVRKNIR